jgi:hypothetical protein
MRRASTGLTASIFASLAKVAVDLERTAPAYMERLPSTSPATVSYGGAAVPLEPGWAGNFFAKGLAARIASS